MRKLYPETNGGTEFIQLSKLPFNQALPLKDWLAETDIFSIHKQNSIIKNCIHYDVYEFWFDNYKSENYQTQLSLF